VNLIFQLLGWGMRPSTSPAKAVLIRMLFAGDEEGERRFREGERWRRESEDKNEGEDEREREEEEDEQEDEQQQSRKRTLDAFSEVFVATFHLFDKGKTLFYVLLLLLIIITIVTITVTVTVTITITIYFNHHHYKLSKL
jgi:hypothetical protein